MSLLLVTLFSKAQIFSLSELLAFQKKTITGIDKSVREKGFKFLATKKEYGYVKTIWTYGDSYLKESILTKIVSNTYKAIKLNCQNESYSSLINDIQSSKFKYLGESNDGKNRIGRFSDGHCHINFNQILDGGFEVYISEDL